MNSDNWLLKPLWGAYHKNFPGGIGPPAPQLDEEEGKGRVTREGGEESLGEEGVGEVEEEEGEDKEKR